MKTHLVTADFDSAGRLRLMYAGKKYGIECRVDQFAENWGAIPSARERDLANIAAAIYAADRLVKRPGRDRDPARRIHLVIGVTGSSFIESRLPDSLSELLYFLTGDEWHIQLVPTSNPSAMSRQLCLGLVRQQAVQVCLYSDGLDSAAGLAARRRASPGPWLAITVGHQTGVRHRVGKLINLHRKWSAMPLLSAQLVAGLRGAPAASRQELSQRARGVLFCIAAGLAAKWSGAERVEVFENGVGAFNMPLMTGMLHGGRSSRGAHPYFLAWMSEILTSALDHPLTFVLPFCWQTKAEMLRSLPADQAAELIGASRSCVHTSIRISGKDHCGECPACIERQITLHTAGLRDNPIRYRGSLDRSWQPTSKSAGNDYICLRRRRASGAIDLSDDYRALRRNYMRTCGLTLPKEKNLAFDRLMSRDGHECLEWMIHNDLTENRLPNKHEMVRLEN